MHIYLKGLTKIAKIIYVAPEKQRNNIPDILKMLTDQDNVVFLPKNSIISQIKWLDNLIETYKPANMFMYTTPDDVIIPVVFHKYHKYIKRYQINLTDHAFWLGAKCFDYCIEFRDYGAYITNHYRNVPKEKILLLPYYPIIDKNQKFEGYPFDYMPDKQKIIFSGGSLYKTISKNGLYYKIIDRILSKHQNVIFWYAGSGKTEHYFQMKELINKYPKRVFLTNERKDLYQVLRHCNLYLSTYPICGGLMYQYAAIANRLPITLKYDDCSDGILLNQNKLGIIFDNFNELIQEIDKLLTNDSLLKEKESTIQEAIIKEEEFNLQLAKILTEHKSDFSLQFYPVKTEEFRASYLTRFTDRDLNIILSREKSIYMKFPIKCIKGLFNRIFNKI